MSVVWTPDPAAVPWFSVYAHESWGPRTISAQVEAPAGGGEGDASGGGATTPPASITGYACTVSPDTLDGLVVAASASGVAISAPDGLAEAFPMIDLEYQINRAEFHITKWEDLPQEADEMIAYHPDPSSQRDWTITVTAELSDGTSETGAFVLRLLQNFDPGKEALKEAVDARR